jgi:hypothetical protein
MTACLSDPLRLSVARRCYAVVARAQRGEFLNHAADDSPWHHDAHHALQDLPHRLANRFPPALGSRGRSAFSVDAHGHGHALPHTALDPQEL